MGKFYTDLKAGLTDAIAHKKGKISLRSETLEMPKPPADYKAREVKKIRETYNYSQSIFAKILNVSTKTVQSWESGERNPSHAALRLLEIIDKGIYKPELLRKR